MASIRRSLLSLLRFSGAVRTSTVTNSRVQVLPCSNTGEAIATTWGRKLSWYRRFNSISGEDSHANKTLCNQEEIEKRLSGLTLSDSCVKQLHSVVDTPDTMLRVTVEGGGCSGFQYKFMLDTTVNTDDKVFERDGAKVVIDELSLGFLDGSTIDYHQELIRSTFRITNNPNIELGCSCGISFAMK